MVASLLIFIKKRRTMGVPQRLRMIRRSSRYGFIFQEPIHAVTDDPDADCHDGEQPELRE